MATAIITSATRSIDMYSTSVSGDYISNQSNVLRRVAAAIHDAFGHGSHVLLDDSGKPYNGQTIGVRFENPYVSDGRYVITYSITADRVCDIKSLGGIPRPVYDERVVRRVVDLALGRVGMALGEMIGFRFPSFLDADVTVTIATTDERRATAVIEITDKAVVR